MGMFEKEIKQKIASDKKAITKFKSAGASSMIAIYEKGLIRAEKALKMIKSGTPEQEAYDFFLGLK